MSQLNLSPDPIVLGAQAVIFLANMFVIKKLILNPYLKVREQREASTGGNQDEAFRLINEAKALETKITDRMRDVHKEAALLREKIKVDAASKRQIILADAEKKSKTAQANIETEIENNLKEERAKKDSAITAVTDFLFTQTTH